MVSIKYVCFIWYGAGLYFHPRKLQKYELHAWADFCSKNYYINCKTGIVINDTKQAELLSIEAVQNT